MCIECMRGPEAWVHTCAAWCAQCLLSASQDCSSEIVPLPVLLLSALSSHLLHGPFHGPPSLTGVASGQGGFPFLPCLLSSSRNNINQTLPSCAGSVDGTEAAPLHRQPCLFYSLGQRLAQARGSISNCPPFLDGQNISASFISLTGLRVSH